MIVSAKGRVARWVWCDSVFLSMAVVSSASIPASHSCLCLTRFRGVGCRCRQGLKGQRAQPRRRSTDVLPLQEQNRGNARRRHRGAHGVSLNVRSPMTYPVAFMASIASTMNVPAHGAYQRRQCCGEEVQPIVKDHMRGSQHTPSQLYWKYSSLEFERPSHEFAVRYSLHHVESRLKLFAAQGGRCIW